jgi:hypothetical protein
MTLAPGRGRVGSIVAIAGLTVAAVCSHRAFAESSAVALQSPLSRLPAAEKRECEMFGEAYLRIAELRDAGAAQSVAVDRAVEYLNRLGRTGSHHRGKDYRPAVAQFAQFIYRNPKLQRASLYLYGLSSCAISKLARDDASFDRSMTTLDRVTGACQKRHPGQENAKALGACILAPVNAEIDKLAGAAGQGSGSRPTTDHKP